MSEQEPCIHEKPGIAKIEDPVLHFFACLPYERRDEYFNDDNKIDENGREKIRDEGRRITKVRGFVAWDAEKHGGGRWQIAEPMTENPDDCLVCHLQGSLQEWRKVMFDKVRDIIKRRRAEMRGEDPNGTGGANRHGDEAGTTSEPVCPGDADRDTHSSDEAYDCDGKYFHPDEDTKAYLIEYKYDDDGDDPGEKLYKKKHYDDPTPDDEEKLRRALWKGVFPSRKAMVSDILDKEKKVLPNARKAAKERLMYFHFPANNMEWVEVAMSRYYGNGDGASEADTLLRNRYWEGQIHGGHESFVHARHLRPLCEIVSSDPDRVDPEPNNIVLFMPILNWDTDRKQQTFSRIIRERTATHQKAKLADERNARQIRRDRLQAFYRNLDLPNEVAVVGRSHEDILTDRNENGLIDTFHGAVVTKVGGDLYQVKSRWSYPPRDKNGRLIFVHKLAQLLYDAAKLMEEMDNYRDKQLIQRYLYNDKSPSISLHPRRTLDQAYYCSLKNTASRDRDQVVYRGTMPRKDPGHMWIREDRCRLRKDDKCEWGWTCGLKKTGHRAHMRHEAAADLVEYFEHFDMGLEPCDHCHGPKTLAHDYGFSTWKFPWRERSEGEMLCGQSRDWRKSGCKTCGTRGIGCGCKPDNDSTDEMEQNITRPCDQCLTNIKMLARVVMVDQLWMWILDESTILTFFPKRYGRNREDLAGIHKSIRIRVSKARDNQIKSVFDLALIILSECTKPFFDRTRTTDMQPRVLDLFSDAIGHVAHKQMLAASRVWEAAEKLRRVCLTSNPPTGLASIHVPMLNNAPESSLQREIKDILDELNILIHLVEQQRLVLQKFVKNARVILSRNKSGEWQDGTVEKKEAVKEEKPAAKEEDNKTEGSQGQQKPKNDKQAYGWFKVCSQDVISDVESFLMELKNLKSSATSTSDEIDRLLSSKQQQASAIQAWQSIIISEEAAKQGRSIMIFTTMTIVFLPLSFIAAIFGMNNPEFDTSQPHPVTLGKQLGIMFGASSVLTSLVLALAFSAMLRALCWSRYHLWMTSVLIRTGIYRWWAQRRMTWSSTSQIRRTEAVLRRTKAIEIAAAQSQYKRHVQEGLKKKHQDEDSNEHTPVPWDRHICEDWEEEPKKMPQNERKGSVEGVC